MNTNTPVENVYEISPRFRRMIEERIDRLERDAVTDELNLNSIDNEDHMRRHLRWSPCSAPKPCACAYF